ncbi:MAG: hypothetical protein A2Y15_07470 [Clostridiales bacterium GWF2_36_10]|nr:MAG: hypothetical protein A2Y15_07470 [Clostridiales bacterium GWF2_36_10]
MLEQDDMHLKFSIRNFVYLMFSVRLITFRLFHIANMHQKKYRLSEILIYILDYTLIASIVFFLYCSIDFEENITCK